MSTGFEVAELHNLGITSEGRWVIRDLNFAITVGQLVPVLTDGTNAATKLLLELAGVLPAREGRVDIAGGRRAVAVGYTPDLDMIDPSLTPLEQGRDLAVGLRLSDPLNRTWTNLQTVGLDAFAQIPASELDEAGMVRLGLALALLQDPRMIVLPTLGAEAGPEAEAQWELLFYLCSLGYAIVVGCQQPHPACPVVIDLRRPAPMPPEYLSPGGYGQGGYDQSGAWVDQGADPYAEPHADPYAAPPPAVEISQPGKGGGA